MTKDSRLEKFLKALCSLDYSDLPTPLSRVEVLWNCLITGEATPDFQPQSRTEKYLMTILGVYDLEDIPKPISRAETLLYKLATGDTDVELEDGAKSRYERLLSEIITNGGVGGNVDFEYVTYVLSESFNTLHNTAEKPVKSAILKGQTLVNVQPNSDFFVDSQSIAWLNTSTTIQPVEGGRYFIKFYNKPINLTGCFFGAVKVTIGNGDYGIVNAKSSQNLLHVYGDDLKSDLFVNCKVLICEYQDGMENWDIPFFEGMQSVKVHVLTTNGKNLFNKEKFIDENQWSADSNKTYRSIPLQLEPNTVYTMTRGSISCTGHGLYVNLSNNRNSSSGAHWWLFHHSSNYNNKISFTTNETGIIYFNSNTVALLKNYKDLLNEVQLEKGNTITSYEPFKSNILTVNEEVALRGVGDVRDELDLLTGELTQRINEVTIDGSSDEGWSFNGDRGTVVSLISNNITGNKNGTGVLCKDFQTLSNSIISDTELIRISEASGKIIVQILKEKIGGGLDETGEEYASLFKKWLSDNPLTIQYELATESVKTVDLTTLDQDGNKTKLKTFNDITHVSLSSEGLIPEAEMTVVTKNLDDISQASTMSLRMNDISEKQNELQSEVDTQSESIDSTMIATTEIYEQTL